MSQLFCTVPIHDHSEATHLARQVVADLGSADERTKRLAAVTLLASGTKVYLISSAALRAQAPGL